MTKFVGVCGVDNDPQVESILNMLEAKEISMFNEKGKIFLFYFGKKIYLKIKYLNIGQWEHLLISNKKKKNYHKSEIDLWNFAMKNLTPELEVWYPGDRDSVSKKKPFGIKKEYQFSVGRQ